MTHQRVDAAAGWKWIVSGWHLFTRSPGLWVVMAVLFGIIYFVLSWVPFLGPLAALVLAPALFGGMVHGARELDQGRSLDIAYLFHGLRDSSLAGAMLVLGLVPLVAAILTGVLSVAVIGGAGGPTAGAGLVLFLGALLIGLASGALLLFAIPRVMQRQATPMDALTQSAVAVRDNPVAFVMFAATYVMLAIFAAIPLGLGFLVLLPVIAGAIHCAHREVFGDEPAGAAD